MKKKETDILSGNNMTEFPFSVPEGYFDGLKERLTDRTGHRPAVTFRTARYLAAAAVALLFAAGGVLLADRDTDDFTQEDYLVFSEEMTNTVYQEYTGLYAESPALTEDDIIEYLIYAGIDIEDIEQY